MKVKVFGFLGSRGGKLDLCGEASIVPSDSTGRLQEAHIIAGRVLMVCIEDSLFESGYIELQS